MNETIIEPLWMEDLPGSSQDAPELALQASTSACQEELLPLLLDGIDRASGWLLHRTTLSAVEMVLKVEVQGRNLISLYAALMAAGLDLTHQSHRLLHDRCTWVRYKTGAKRALQPLQLQVLFTESAFSRIAWARIPSA